MKLPSIGYDNRPTKETMDNRPSTPPPAPGTVSGAGTASLDEVASGQRILILAIVVNLGTVALRGALGDNWAIIGPLAVVAATLAIVGLLRLGNGLGYSGGMKALLVVLAFVPLASLVMLVMVNGRATKALKAGGYKVGFFGATGKKETV